MEIVVVVFACNKDCGTVAYVGFSDSGGCLWKSWWFLSVVKIVVLAYVGVSDDG